MSIRSLQVAFDVIDRDNKQAQNAQPLPPKHSFSTGHYVDPHEFATSIAKLQALDKKWASRNYRTAQKVLKYLGGHPVIDFFALDRKVQRWYHQSREHHYRGMDVAAIREYNYAIHMRDFMDAARELVKIPTHS